MSYRKDQTSKNDGFADKLVILTTLGQAKKRKHRFKLKLSRRYLSAFHCMLELKLICKILY